MNLTTWNFILKVSITSLVFLIYPSCELFEQDGNGEPPDNELASLFPKSINNFEQLFQIEEPPNSFIEDVLVSGGYAISEWISDEGDEFIISTIMKYSSITEASGIFSGSDTIGQAISYPVADKAFLGREINRFDLVGNRILYFQRNNYLVSISNGTLDSTLPASDSSLLISLSQAIDNNIINFKSSDLKSSEINPFSVTKNTGRKLIPGEVQNHDQYLTINLKGFRHPITMNESKGKIELEFYPIEGYKCGDCGSEQKPLKCNFINIEVFMNYISLNKNAWSGDKGLFGLWSNGEVIMAGVVQVQFHCYETEVLGFEFVSGEVGEINSGDTIKFKLEDDGKGKNIGTISLGCQCMDPSDKYAGLLTQANFLFRDEDATDVSDWVEAMEKFAQQVVTDPKIKLGIGGTLTIKQLLKRQPQQDAIGPDAFNALRAVRGDDIGVATLTEPVKIEF